MFYIFRHHDEAKMASFPTEAEAARNLYAYWNGSNGTAAYEVRDTLGNIVGLMSVGGRQFNRKECEAMTRADRPRRGDRDIRRQMLEANGCDPDDADTWEGL